jgi:hypothetical protein
VGHGSELIINLPSSFAATNPEADLLCSAPDSASTLFQQTCFLRQNNTNGEGQLQLRVILRDIGSQTLFAVHVQLRNPEVEGNYTMSAQLFKNEILYAQGSLLNGSPVRVPIRAPTSPSTPAGYEIRLKNYPQNIGESSHYVFSIPPLPTIPPNISQVSIVFPPQHAAQLGGGGGEELSCGFYLTESVPNPDSFRLLDLYSRLLRQGFLKISCSVVSDRRLAITQELFNLSSHLTSNSWLHLVVSGLENPSEPFVDTYEFSLQQGSKTVWSHSNSILLNVLRPSQLSSLQNLAVQDPNIKVLSDYNFTVNN